MKSLLALILAVAVTVSFTGCGNKESNIESTGESGTENSTTINESSQDESTLTTSPSPEPMDKIKITKKVLRGSDTGTKKTYTGYEPLKEVELPVVDPENIRNLPTKSINHSFGVSKDEIPHEISVENQKIYSKYKGLCLDTSGERVIYLTFDCGYENGCTNDILDVLQEKNVKAAFFVTLDHVKSNPELISRMIKEGHIVGNHSTTHPNFSGISRLQMANEIQTLDNYLRVNFGYSAPFFRFPEGACSESALDLVANAGFVSVFWSSAYADWDVNSQKGKQYAYDTVTARLHPGCVLLLHAVSYDNAQALGDIIDYAHRKNYTFKSLENS